MSVNTFTRLSTVVDCAALMTRCLNNLEFAENMVALFREHGSLELQKLEQACKENNWDEACKVAHRFHGACANAAAIRLQGRVMAFRNAALIGDNDEASASLEALQREWRRFETAMETSNDSFPVCAEAR